jgi:RNA-directed DNA polymerase
MTVASTAGSMSLELRRVEERARREPQGRFHSLAHLIDEAALARAYHRLRGDAAVGVDGVTKEQYGEDLEENLRDLHERLRTKRYRHQPIRRVQLPKEGGGRRPIGVSATEDKVVQGAVREVLEAVYEQDFLDCSYGFRPGRSAHDALRALNAALYGGEGSWVVEADLLSFFDSVDRRALREMLQERIADGSLWRLIAKCLHVGVLDGEAFTRPDEGTAQGSALSPLLGNVYLHYALDRWFEREVKPRLKGKAQLIRYSDDFVIVLSSKDEAERVMGWLGQRLGRYGLRLNPEKTRLVDFRRPVRRQSGGKGPPGFDFLGFTWYWRRSRRGHWVAACKTRRARLGRAIRSVQDFCRRHRHESIPAQHAALTRRLRGHYQYFGVNGNHRSLDQLRYHAERAWYRWLCRRSQKKRLDWKRFQDLLRDFPLPRPRVVVAIWAPGSSSRLSGGAGWWKSPCPDLARAPAG